MGQSSSLDPKSRTKLFSLAKEANGNCQSGLKGEWKHSLTKDNTGAY